MESNSNKLLKKALREQQRRIRPGECQKYVRLVLDETFSKSPCGVEVVSDLKNSNINLEIRNIEENCIYWERNLGQRQIISNADLDLYKDWEMEQQVLKILTKEEFQRHIKQKTLLKVANRFRAAFPDKSVTLVVPRIKDKNGELTNEFTKTLVEVQVLEMPSIQIKPDDVTEISELLKRFNKSIAEAPFKQQKAQSLCIFKKFLGNDNKQCVRVAGTTGFGRLWQQHLCRLPLVTLDIAETIRYKYKNPKMLIEAYENDSNTLNNIADLRINQGVGPDVLTNDRRIGNALSTKLHKLYNTRDPNECI